MICDMAVVTAPRLLLVASALLLASCGGREAPTRTDANATTENARQCMASLKEKSVRFAGLPNKSFDGGCRTIDTVKLMDFGTPTTNLGAMTCPLAANFTDWARYAVRPAAKQYLGADVVRIETMGTFNCRNIYGGRSGKLSEHAFANAVDVSAFVLRDGRRVSVLSGWNRSSEERAFLRRLHQSACKRFGTVLGPDYNAAHANHFHLDMARSMRNGTSFCR
ncbi:MAG: extensin [Sphingomonadaceae bacterium PASS1]|nr:MAG: extensin [Sphingomonadaceae bacterium PASS1]